MRKDMAKVIVERPRRGSRGPYRQAFWEKNTPFEDLPTKIGMRLRWGYGKALNENLAPLRRYLRAQVGHRWDDIYSDISRHLRPTCAVQQHVRDHLSGLVELNPTLGPKGRIYQPRAAGGRPAQLKKGSLYVDPESGVLKAAKRKADWEA